MERGQHHANQHEAASRVDEFLRDGSLFTGWMMYRKLCDPKEVSGLDRVLLLRHLRLPLPLTRRNCRCGLPLDSCGHHPCARVGVPGRRGFVVENVAARICREVGGRVTTNVVVRDMDTRVLKLWWTDSPCLVVSSWLWIPQWSVLFMPMFKHGRSALFRN